MTNARILIITLALLLCASQTLAAEFKSGLAVPQPRGGARVAAR